MPKLRIFISYKIHLNENLFIKSNSNKLRTNSSHFFLNIRSFFLLKPCRVMCFQTWLCILKYSDNMIGFLLFWKPQSGLKKSGFCFCFFSFAFPNVGLSSIFSCQKAHSPAPNTPHTPQCGHVHQENILPFVTSKDVVK